MKLYKKTVYIIYSEQKFKVQRVMKKPAKNHLFVYPDIKPEQMIG